jgi:biopolymer transport protein ExbB/TolQ
MSEIVSNLVAVYLQIGFMAVFSLTILGAAIWYLAKGRKEFVAEKERKDKLYQERYAVEHEDRQAIAVEIARSGKVIENCTAVINNNSKVIEESCKMRQADAMKLDQILSEVKKNDATLETLVINQALYMERQKAEYSRK